MKHSKKLVNSSEESMGNMEPLKIQTMSEMTTLSKIIARQDKMIAELVAEIEKLKRCLARSTGG